jgi:hypothetical protein
VTRTLVVTGIGVEAFDCLASVTIALLALHYALAALRFRRGGLIVDVIAVRRANCVVRACKGTKPLSMCSAVGAFLSNGAIAIEKIVVNTPGTSVVKRRNADSPRQSAVIAWVCSVTCWLVDEASASVRMARITRLRNIFHWCLLEKTLSNLFLW